jgi:hypothetical protein
MQASKPESGGHLLSQISLGVSISTRGPGSPYIRQISLSETDAQITNNRHSAIATWFGHFRAADAIESSSHPAVVPGFFCGLAGTTVPTAQSCITTMTTAAYSTTKIGRRKSKILISKET